MKINKFKCLNQVDLRCFEYALGKYFKTSSEEKVIEFVGYNTVLSFEKSVKEKDEKQSR